MQIGHKIYYDKITGFVVLDKGEMQGDVRETTFEEDKLAYSSLNEYTQNTIGLMQLTYGERSDEFNNLGSMQVINNQLIIYPRLSVEVDKSEITSDGIDTSAITVTIADTINSYAINFVINNGEPIVINTTNGIAMLPISTTIADTYNIKITSNLYGTCETTIKGV